VAWQCEPLVSGKTPIVGLTGGIGSGKSLVARFLRELGALVLDADETAHQVLAEPDVLDTLKRWWGPSVVGPDGRVDRRRVAEIVFQDPDQRRRLEELTHPRIFSAWAETLQRCRQDPTAARVLVIDAPLLFEVGLDETCDLIVFVDAPEEQRIQRVLEHRGWSAGELRRREKMQKSLDIKRTRADYIVENNSSVRDLHHRVEEFFSRFRFPQ
jgi:dephospho-CoA kinase